MLLLLNCSSVYCLIMLFNFFLFLCYCAQKLRFGARYDESCYFACLILLMVGWLLNSNLFYLSGPFVVVIFIF